MLTDTLAGTIVFPWVLFDRSNNEIRRGNGLIFGPLPGFNFEVAANHVRTAPIGWSRCPGGYACYIQKLQLMGEHKLALVGLRVKGISSAEGKSGDVQGIKTKPMIIENYVRELSLSFNKVEREYVELINGSVHEIRHINTDIKSATEESVHLLNESPVDVGSCRTRAMNVRALSDILSARVDFLELLSNPAVLKEDKKPVVAYQKFDKIKRSLEARAAEKNIKIYMDGLSHGRVNAMKVFDVIPYILVQNAIKYSPANREVRVHAWDDDDATRVVFRVRNWGPKLEDRELSSVFSYGSRGVNVQRTGERGSGIGLYFVRELITYHGGDIAITQGPEVQWINGIEYAEVTITVRLPRSE